MGAALFWFSLLTPSLDSFPQQRVAQRAISALWRRRSNTTQLMGSVIDIQTGVWLDRTASMGAGVDSFYEYLLKVRSQRLI